ncbi:MAG TPA: CxxxxCH/CxxCH domain-containing protein [Anaeromyxobacter sp.]
MLRPTGPPPRAASLVLAVSLILAAGCGEPRRLVGGGRARCTICHGSGDDPAPPRSPLGESSTAEPGVGAHRLHLRDTAIRLALACSECHVVPDRVDAPGHLHGPLLSWGPLATARGAQPSWDAAGLRCSGVYCHGGIAAIHGGSSTAPVWTYAAEPDYALPPEQTCTSCHGWPPPAPHPQLTGCAGCHGKTVRADGTIDVAGGKHVNGAVDFGGSGDGTLHCDSCHGYPPPSGAHLVHFGWTEGAGQGAYGDARALGDLVAAGLLPPSHPAYAFECGNCHPLDVAKHMDGVVQVELADPGAPAGSLKSRNPQTAAYSSGRCSSVYCHSSGQADDAAASTPVHVVTPAWTSGATIGCSSCHGNPPRYPSGGPGAVTANSHLGLAFDDYEFGHFGGMPGVWHPGPTFGSKHGQGDWTALNDASPITCQTCHYATVDPARTGPSGFYYLDTSGDYLLAGSVTHYDCLACHSAGDPAAPTRTGGVLPLFHVNGTRDVVFDPREALPAIPWLPSAPFTPSRPFWVTNASPLVDTLPAGAVYDPAVIPPPPGETWPFTERTLSLHLGDATWAPATKTCSNVACHLAETSVVWGGAPEDYFSPCARCHGL